MATDDKPSPELRWLLSEGATRDDVQAWVNRRCEKVKADYREMVAMLIRGMGREAGIAEARKYLEEDAEKGLPPEFVAGATAYLDRLANKG